jgi:hypothetical protein
MHVIDTSALAPEEVAAQLIDWSRQALAGDAPSMSVACG